MHYRLLALDLDGTLLAPDGAVPAAHVAAVERARAAGVDVVVATGRAWCEARDALRAISCTDVMIGAGGAQLCGSADGRSVRRSRMPVALVRAIVEALVRHGHRAHLLLDGSTSDHDYVFVGDAPLDGATTWWMRTHAVRTRELPRFDHDPTFERSVEHTLRVGTVATGRSLGAVVAELRADIGDDVLIQHWPAVVESRELGEPVHLLECFNSEVDKWTMLSALAAERNVPIESIAAVGDGLNDRTMIRNAGLGIAMADGDERVRADAAFVVPTSAEDGVAVAIDRVLAATPGGRA